MGNIKNFISGEISGLSIVLVGHPFDTIKTRIQYNKKVILTPKYQQTHFRFQ